MTYGLGMLLEAGLVLVADTRTNAGVDNVSSYRKLHKLACVPGRDIYAVSSGSLSASQRAVGLLLESQQAPLDEAPSMFAVAQIVGDSVAEANRRIGEALAPSRKAGACMLVGGRISDQPPRLFLVYEEGNFIECKPDAPFLQVGETKYGRPILDRTIRPATPLPAAVKIALLSFDSAMRSNLAVARPLDMMVMPADSKQSTLVTRIEKDDPYFNALSERWSDLLVEATLAVPDPAFLAPADSIPPFSVVARSARA